MEWDVCNVIQTQESQSRKRHVRDENTCSIPQIDLFASAG